MKWRGRRSSSNVEDRRGSGMARKVGGGGIGVVLLALVAMYFGVDPSVVLNQGGGMLSGGSKTETAPYKPTAEEAELAAFVSVVLAETEDTWHEIFRGLDGRYQEPTLVLFSGSVQSACGLGQAAMGPFYCPGDKKVYIDLSFYRDLKNRHRAPGDFAQAYVIAHEVGHHVQNLLGISGKVEQAKRRMTKEEGNVLSVMLELQADCFSGVWAHDAKRAQILEAGDVEEALTAASAIGDDRLQRQARGYVTPESFTHGTSEQRVRWFKTGLQQGDINSCNTFGAERL